MAALEATVQQHSRRRWLINAPVDFGVALAWIPFSAVTYFVLENSSALKLVVAATFAFSLSHQPLTLPLVYGDSLRFSAAKKVFTWAPPILLGLILLGQTFGGLVLVATVAGVWNTGHTLQQRYGLTRIYGRFAGHANGRTEQTMLWSWLLFTMMFVATDAGLLGRVTQLGLGELNEKSLQILVDTAAFIRPALWGFGIAAIVLALKWVRDELSHGTVNPAKWLYVGSTAVLFAVMVWQPVVGFVGWVGSHALEYYVVVHHHLGSRYGGGDHQDAAISRFARTTRARIGFVVVYVLAVFGLMKALSTWGSALAYSLVFLMLGAMHLLYDGFIWKLRDPEIAKAFHINTDA